MKLKSKNNKKIRGIGKGKAKGNNILKNYISKFIYKKVLSYYINNKNKNNISRKNRVKVVKIIKLIVYLKL